MTYFHTDRTRDLMWLRDVLDTAVREERSVRFDVDSEGNLKVKVGEGMWTAPIAGTPDPYRDCCFKRCNGDKFHDSDCVNA